jgi:hypothetical protein
VARPRWWLGPGGGSAPVVARPGDSRSESCLLVTEDSTVDSIPFSCSLFGARFIGFVHNWFFQA